MACWLHIPLALISHPKRELPGGISMIVAEELLNCASELVGAAPIEGALLQPKKKLIPIKKAKVKMFIVPPKSIKRKVKYLFTKVQWFVKNIKIVRNYHII
jgi:hypothetical protein